MVLTKPTATLASSEENFDKIPILRFPNRTLLMMTTKLNISACQRDASMRQQGWHAGFQAGGNVEALF